MNRDIAILGGLLALVFVPSLALIVAAGTGLAASDGVLAAVLFVPLAVVTVALAVVARVVAREADEPSLIDERMEESLDMSSEEYRELTEE